MALSTYADERLIDFKLLAKAENLLAKMLRKPLPKGTSFYSCFHKNSAITKYRHFHCKNSAYTKTTGAECADAAANFLARPHLNVE